MSEELTDFQKEYLEDLKKEEQEELVKHADIIRLFKNHMSKVNISLDDSNFIFYRTSGVLAKYSNIISFLHPDLIPDKEGLFDFKKLAKTFELKARLTGYFISDNFMLMANPYFRRGYHDINNFAPKFVELFWNFNDPNIETYISLDTNQVRINVDESIYRELDTWYGAEFNKEIKDIPDGNVKVRPPQDLEDAYIDFFFSNAYSLDIKWATKGNIKSFQAEEFKTANERITKDAIKYYPVRYLHAEYDIEKGYFRHFDGAIHFYTEAEYYSRRDSDFNYNNKSQAHIKTLSQKLFKLNGIIPSQVWIEFCSQFLTHNPLVFEYFEGQYPKHIIELLEKIRSIREQE